MKLSNNLVPPKRYVFWFIILMKTTMRYPPAKPLCWRNLITTSRRDRTLEIIGWYGKSSPFMAARFRWVNYCNLPRLWHFSEMFTNATNLVVSYPTGTGSSQLTAPSHQRGRLETARRSPFSQWSDFQDLLVPGVRHWLVGWSIQVFGHESAINRKRMATSLWHHLAITPLLLAKNFTRTSFRCAKIAAGGCRARA